MIKGQSAYLRSIKDEDMERIFQSAQDEEFLYMIGTRKSLKLNKIIES